MIPRRLLGTVLAIAMIAAGAIPAAAASCGAPADRAAIQRAAGCCCDTSAAGPCASLCQKAPQADQRAALIGPAHSTPCAMAGGEACRLRHTLQPHAPCRLAYAPHPPSCSKRYLAFCILRL